MLPEARAYLDDIQRASELLERFTTGKTFAEYTKDDLLRSATELQFEIIGEAISKLAKVDAVTASRITEYQRIISFRNFLIHQYSAVEDELVWNFLKTKLPILSIEVHGLLAEGSILPEQPYTS